MQQRGMNFKDPSDRPDTDFERVAHGKFTQCSMPENFETAINDPLFCKLIKARATQMVRSLKESRRKALKSSFEVIDGRLD